MSYTLSEQEKSLLSAFHDGEATATEATQAQQLLQRSPEARAWLRDARSVRNISVEATMRLPLPPLSGKLTGSAIVTAATKQGTLSGGSFFAAARSPFGLAGAAALLIAGAIWTFQELNDPARPNSATEQIAVASGTNSKTVGAATPASLPQLDDNALMVPPITAHDLVGFALNGTLPINAERTQFVGMESTAPYETNLAQEIEEGVGMLKPLHVRALDSLSELVRSSMVRMQGNGWAVRSDLPDLRLAVIDRLQEARLSGAARSKLTAARTEAKEHRSQFTLRLENEIRGMEAKLLAPGEQPYVFIQSDQTIETPAGSQNSLAILEIIGTRHRIININPQDIRITEPNPSLGVTLAIAEPVQKKHTAPKKATGTRAAAANDEVLHSASVTTDEGWQWIATEPFMQSVTISIFGNAGMSIIVSDEVDTTWQSQTVYVNDDLYSLSTRIDALTEMLNVRINTIVNDRSKSPEVRAWNIIKVRRDYKRQLEILIDSANKADEKSNPPAPQSNDSLKTDPYEEAAEHDEFKDEKPLECSCLPLEDCTGMG